MSNTFGKNCTLTTFGASHSDAIGGVIDGFPKDVVVDFSYIKTELQRRKTGNYSFSSQRKEPDEVIFLSGIDNGTTNGFPIAFFIQNKNAKSKDYQSLNNIFRPSHADYTYHKKYGITDFAGGGRASGRETTSWVVAGALAKLYLRTKGINFYSYVSQIGPVIETEPYTSLQVSEMSKNPLPTPNSKTAQKMMSELSKAQGKKETLGGVVTSIIEGLWVGVGDPVFNKLSARLAMAMLSIPSAKGFDYGEGFNAAFLKGSQCNDTFIYKDHKISTATNRNGGIQGGISNGEPIVFRVAFKPIPSIGLPQQTVDAKGKPCLIEVKGRHDVCIVPRVLPVVESMAAMVLLDFLV